jgi:hypothetical protein
VGRLRFGLTAEKKIFIDNIDDGHFTDWKDNDKNPRTLHKTCWKEEQKYKDIMYNFKRWNITDNDKLDFLLN